MKITAKTFPILAIATLMATASCGAGSRYSISDIDDGVNAPGVIFSVDKDGTARLMGTVGSDYDKILLEEAAKKLDGVKVVINSLSTS